MIQRFTTVPPSVNFALLAGTNAVLAFPRIPFDPVEVEGNMFVVAEITPTAVFCRLDPGASGIYNATSETYYPQFDGFNMASALLVSLSCRSKVAPSADLLDNNIIMLIGGVTVASIQVDAASQKCGLHFWNAAAAEAGDTRFSITGAGSAITGGTMEADDEIYTKSGHGLITGQPVTLTSLTGGTGVVAGTLYFFHRLSSSTGYLCSTYVNALAGTAVPITLDATSVVLTPRQDIGFAITTVDPNLVIDLRLVGSDSSS